MANINAQSILQSVTTKKDVLKGVDKKISISAFKDGNKMKTEIIGLDDFMELQDITKFTKKIKTDHGCSGTISNVDKDKDKKKVTFSGDQIENIVLYITNNNIASKEQIKY